MDAPSRKCEARPVDRIRVVLLRTHNGKNLGAVARGMHNFGRTNLVLADPGPLDWSDVSQMAVRSKHITEAAPRVSTLREAVSGCSWVVGTTMRALGGQRGLHPREVAAGLVERSRAGQEVAIVFGEERVGLTNQDLLECHDTSIIPTADLASLNLAQAVLLYLWEIAQAEGEVSAPVSPAAMATTEDYAALEGALREHLVARGFRDPDRPRNGVKDLLQTLERAGLTAHEARLWGAALNPRGRTSS